MGGQHNYTENQALDIERSMYLSSLGIRVVRFWNNEVADNITGIYDELIKVVSILKS